MHKDRLNHYIPNIIISILLTFVLLAFIIVYLISSMVVSPKTYTDAMYKNDVDKIAYEQICTYFDRQYSYTGVEADVFKNAVNQADVSAAIFTYVDSTFEYMSGKTTKLPEFVFDYTSLENAVHNDYIRWAEENDFEYNKKAQTNEKTTIDTAKKVIDTKLDVMMLTLINKENGISTIVHNNYSKINIISIILLAALLLLIGTIVFLNRKRKRNILYWCSVFVFSASIMLIIPTLLLKITKYFDRLVLKNDSVYNALTQSLHNITNKIFAYGLILFAASAILMFIYHAMRKQMFKFRHV